MRRTPGPPGRSPPGRSRGAVTRTTLVRVRTSCCWATCDQSDSSTIWPDEPRVPVAHRLEGAQVQVLQHVGSGHLADVAVPEACERWAHDGLHRGQPVRSAELRERHLQVTVESGQARLVDLPVLSPARARCRWPLPEESGVLPCGDEVHRMPVDVVAVAPAHLRRLDVDRPHDGRGCCGSRCSRRPHPTRRHARPPGPTSTCPRRGAPAPGPSPGRTRRAAGGVPPRARRRRRR